MDIQTLIRTGDIESAKNKIKKDPSLINATNFGDLGAYSTLHNAAVLGDIDFVAYLIDNNACVNSVASTAGYITPLCVAAMEGHTNICKLLLEKGALVDGVDSTATTPLMLAARGGWVDITKLLIEFGANVHRLGFVQRFFPADFALLLGENECFKIISAAGGLSVTSDYDWSSQIGFPVDVFVSNKIGPVYPLQLKTAADSTSIRLAKIAKKPKPIYLFTDELHETGNNVELSFVLPPRWGILSEYKIPKSKQSFPIDVIRRLADLVKHKNTILSVGYMIQRSDPDWADLGWPEDIESLIAIDHELGTDIEWLSGRVNKNLELLTLVPLRKNVAKSKIRTQLDVLKNVTLKKLMLPEPLFSE